MQAVTITQITIGELEDRIAKAIRDNLPQPSTAQIPDELLTIQQAAELLSLSIQTIYGKVSRKEIPFMKNGKRLYFSRVELMGHLRGDI